MPIQLKLRGVELFVDNDLYDVLENETTGTSKKVMLSIIKHMEKDLNLIIIAGDTLTSMIKSTGLSESQIRNGISQLKKLSLIEPTHQIRAEYVVNPTLAIKGNHNAVWEFYGKLESLRTGVDVAKMKPTLQLDGGNLPLTDEDYKSIGKFVKRKGK